MSHQNLADAFAPADAHYREQVMQATWGHLAPQRNIAYPGSIVFAVGCYGSDPLNPTVLSCGFKDLDDSPWFFDAMSEFLSSRTFKPGAVYRFDGSFKNYRFRGKITKQEIAS